MSRHVSRGDAAQRRTTDETARTVLGLMTGLLTLILTFGETGSYHGVARTVISVGLVGIVLAYATSVLVLLPGRLFADVTRAGLARVAVTAAAVGGNLYGWTALIAGSAR